MSVERFGALEVDRKAATVRFVGDPDTDVVTVEEIEAALGVLQPRLFDPQQAYDVLNDIRQLHDLRDKLAENWKREEDKAIIRQCFRQMANEV